MAEAPTTAADCDRHLRSRRQFLAASTSLGLAMCLRSPPTLAQTAESRGLQIAREAERRNTGWRSSISRARMILRDRAGSVSVREFEQRALEASGHDEADGGRTLMIFRSPADVEGTTLLTHSHKTREDDQWIYLPALQRVRRISSSGRSGSFLGSEFTYEDMRDAQIQKYTFRHLRDERFRDAQCHVLERRPNDPESSYAHQILWLDESEYRTLKIEYHDRQGNHFKTLDIGEYRRYNEKIWRAHHSAMRNKTTGKTTELIWADYDFGRRLDVRDFERSALGWAR